MKNMTEFEQALTDPQSLESLYQTAKRENWAESFESEIAKRHTDTPDNLLIAAWYFRLQAQTFAPIQRAAPFLGVLQFLLASH